MTKPHTVTLITTSWSGDLDHFRVLMRSLAQGPLANLAHTTAVQTEDLPVFSALSLNSHSRLCSTEQVLLSEVELARRRAQRYQKTFGRHLTRLCGSLCRVLGWPNWPRYTGWHTQQISKLAMAAQAKTDYVLVIDSDVIVTPGADLTDILSRNAIVCFSDKQPLDQFKGKTLNWVMQADSLLRIEPDETRQYDSYFDTPFLLHVATVRAMFDWLEQEYHKSWWQALLAQPPKRWSEFATYKLFLHKLAEEQPGTNVQWLAPDMMQYIFDASDPEQLLSEFRKFWRDPDIGFITIHSQSSGRQRWRADEFSEELLAVMNQHFRKKA